MIFYRACTESMVIRYHKGKLKSPWTSGIVLGSANIPKLITSHILRVQDAIG